MRVVQTGLMVGLMIVGTVASGQGRDEKQEREVARIDEKFLRTLTALAKKYDKEGDPEAAHFFAECAIGFGSKDEKIDEIRRMTEYSVYYGKVRGGKVMNWPERIRACARVRQPLLNANARRLWMGHWEAWSKPAHVTAYNIPGLPYREDIPTPREKYAGKTVAQDWVDTENTIQVGGQTIPYACYPYEGERDAPFAFLDGRGEELGWSDPSGGELEKHGVPIMLRFFCELELSDLAVTLKGSGEKEAPCRIVGL